MTADPDGPDRGGGEASESFLARWSRVKRGGVPAAPAKSPDAAPAPASGDPAASEPAFDLSHLPRIDDLLPSSDITAFLQKGVPDELKRLALQKAWSLDPAIRDFIEVAENQYNWNAADGVPGFGPLDPGLDIQALLAQATGQLQDVAASSTDATSAPPPEIDALAARAGEGSGDAPAGEISAGAPETSEPLAGASGASQTDTVADPRTALCDDAAPQQTARRHGGALPRSV
jgi:hypothetical protein